LRPTRADPRTSFRTSLLLPVSRPATGRWIAPVGRRLVQLRAITE
jgi:hypothetical protein